MQANLVLTAAILVAAALPIAVRSAEPVVQFTAGEKGVDGAEIVYNGQAAADGRIVLDATNGFFDERTFIASGPQPMLPEDDGLINASFESLQFRDPKRSGAARWHVWIETPGTIEAKLFLDSPPQTQWQLQIGSEAQTLTVDVQSAQPPAAASLSFEVKQAGKLVIQLSCLTSPLPMQAEIERIELTGPVIRDAKLLRVRWRPAAVHTRYYAPPECREPTMWVFETECVTPVSSYSPITTPFGYFGTSFIDGKIPRGAGYNFSMWAANNKADEAPTLEAMPQLIATGHPEATFSSFGHEGTGLKLRDAVVHPNGADRAIQAMRMTSDAGVDTFYGYVYNEDRQRWRLFAVGSKPQRTPGRPSDMTSAGSFCEVPGPPNVQRTGDVKRVIRRRGWFYGSDRRWYLADMPTPSVQAKSPRARQDRARLAQGLLPIALNQYSRRAENYLTEGWIESATGGMECYRADQTSDQSNRQAKVSLPEYLATDKIAQLFALPIEFAESRTRTVTAQTAAIEYRLPRSGEDATAVLYYGTRDCMTFRRPDKVGAAGVQRDVFDKSRTWQSATPPQPVRSGSNKFTLDNLDPGTTYYYRLFVSNTEGQSWDFRSSSFSTLD